MRHLAVIIAAAALGVAPALAQQPAGRSAAPARAQPQAQPPPPPGFFPCRTEGEICYLGVVTGPHQLALLFTNDPQAQGAEPKPLELVAGEAPGTPLDVNQHLGRVVMLTGAYDPKAGITKAEVVDVASPVLSFALKAMMAGDEAPQPAQAQGRKPVPRR